MATLGDERRRIGFETGSLRTLDWIAVVLVALTGAIHLYLYAVEGWLPFLLGGLGYAGAIVLLFVLPGYRRYLYVAGILFAGLHIVGYFLQPLGPAWIGYLDKAIEIVLVLVLVQLYRTANATRT